MNIRREIFEFVLDQENRWHRYPSITDVLTLYSGMSEDVELHLEQLEREGLLAIDREGGGKISTVLTYTPAASIPIYGSMAGAKPSSKATSGQNFIRLDLRSAGVETPANLTAMSVSDQSMLDAGLKHGDIALLQAEHPRKGDIVAVEIAGRLVLRRYLIIMGIPHILAENRVRPDLRIAHQFSTHGVLWGVIGAGNRRALSPCKRTVKHVSYSGSTSASGLITPEAAAKSATSDALKLQRGKSVDEKSNRRRAPISYERKDQDWPEPPSGVELNEEAASFLTEDSGVYDTWEPRWR